MFLFLDYAGSSCPKCPGCCNALVGKCIRTVARSGRKIMSPALSHANPEGKPAQMSKYPARRPKTKAAAAPKSPAKSAAVKDAAAATARPAPTQPHAVRRPARLDRGAAPRGRDPRHRRGGRLGLRARHHHAQGVRQRRRPRADVQQHQGLQRPGARCTKLFTGGLSNYSPRRHDVRPAEGCADHRSGEGRAQGLRRAACRRSRSRPAR